MALLENLITYSQNNRLSNNQRVSFESFLKKGFPTKKDEDWKYTCLNNIVSKDYTIGINGDQNELDLSVVEAYGFGFDYKIIFYNGRLLHFPKIDGVVICEFKEFSCKNKDAISQLNAGLASSGFNILIEKNTIINKPIEILFFNTIENGFSQYRNRLTVGENSEVKIIERIQDLSNSSCFSNHYTQINCKINSKLEYNKIQNNSSNFKLIDSLKIMQEKNSTSNVNTLVLNGEFVRNGLSFEQNGSNCESNMKGISVLNGNQFADNHTFVDHKIANCRSNEVYKGVYMDNSKGVFNGKIMVRKDAQKIDAFQQNNNLLLDDKCVIDTKPQLEIYADDVKCSHGCTVGQLDEKALFYMKSRGIRSGHCKALLTYAFMSEALENITIIELKNQVQRLLMAKLNVDLEFS